MLDNENQQNAFPIPPHQEAYGPDWQSQFQQPQPYGLQPQQPNVPQPYGQQLQQPGVPQQPHEQQPYIPQPYEQQLQARPTYPANGMPRQYGQAPQGYGFPVEEASDKSILLIILSAVEFFLAVGPLAIIPLLFAFQYRNAFQSGDYETAESKKKLCIILLIAFGAIAIIVYIACFIFLTFAR